MAVLRLLMLLLLAVPVVAREARELPVLCYHQISPQGDDAMTLRPELFAAHMDYLKRHGYQPVRLEEARLFLWGKKKLRGKPVLITFDDGYEGVYRYALPVLKKHKYPAVMFLVVGKIGSPRPTPHLTLKQLKEMKQTGLFEFGSHTYDLHVLIPERLRLSRVFPDQLLADLKKSRSELKRQLEVEVSALAWPYGHYDDGCLQLGARAGFSMQFGTEYGVSRPYDGTLRIRRLRLSSNSNDLATLRAKLAELY
ncbi:hypothetical protein DYH09_25270 [bacterium CPR1]|nr:hypothetical protein [bacterium CPR1]